MPTIGDARGRFTLDDGTMITMDIHGHPVLSDNPYWQMPPPRRDAARAYDQLWDTGMPKAWWGRAWGLRADDHNARFSNMLVLLLLRNEAVARKRTTLSMMKLVLNASLFVVSPEHQLFLHQIAKLQGNLQRPVS